MREIRPSGSEGGVRLNPSSLPLSARLFIPPFSQHEPKIGMVQGKLAGHAGRAGEKRRRAAAVQDAGAFAGRGRKPLSPEDAGRSAERDSRVGIVPDARIGHALRVGTTRGPGTGTRWPHLCSEANGGGPPQCKTLRARRAWEAVRQLP